jgi:hypothetical protein
MEPAYPYDIDVIDDIIVPLYIGIHTKATLLHHIWRLVVVGDRILKHWKVMGEGG